jgi:electron transfer flavoprotein alpha subunit
MAILLIAEHNNILLSEQTSKALTAARQIGKQIDILIAGKDCRSVAEAATQLSGVHKILLTDHNIFEYHLAEPLADLIVSLAPHYEAILTPATTCGKNVMPRVAAILDVCQISEIIEVVDSNTFKRPIYAGNAIQTVQSSDSIKIITVRTASFALTLSNGSAPIEVLDTPAYDHGSKFISRTLSSGDRPDLNAAKVIISGGRALGSREQFNAVLTPIADKLNAAIGASRAAVDAGFAPNDWQVGQTGKIVAPDLYIACGISGAIQHLAGMKDSKVIVAINKDADAPIFQAADYGIVGDLFEILPELEKLL